MRNNLVANTVLVYGASGSGKMAAVVWAVAGQLDVVVVGIDCGVHDNQIKLFRALADGVRGYSHNCDTYYYHRIDNIIAENMTFDSLN